MARAQKSPQTKEDYLKSLFSQLGLLPSYQQAEKPQQQAVSVRPQDGPQNKLDYKFLYFSHQNICRSINSCGCHTFVHMMAKVMQKRLQSVGSSFRSQDKASFLEYLSQMQTHHYVHRRAYTDRVNATLNSTYCHHTLERRQRQETLAQKAQFEKDLVYFKDEVSFSEDFLRCVVPESLVDFIKEVNRERQAAKVFLKAMVCALFTRSVEVDQIESRASKIKEYVAQVVTMAGKTIPCLTGEHPPVRGHHYPVDIVIEKLNKLPAEFVIPELCALIFKSTRWEFLQEVCKPLLMGPGSREDIKELVKPGIVQKNQPQPGLELFIDVIERILTLLGKVPVYNLLQVACGSAVLLEPVFSQTERREIYGMMVNRLQMFSYLNEAAQKPAGNTTSRHILEEIEDVKTEISQSLNGKDFFELYFDPKTKRPASPLSEDSPASSCVLH